MSIVLTGDLRDAALAAAAQEGETAQTVRAIFAAANWIVIVIVTPAGVTMISLGPQDPLWPVLYEMLGGAGGAGPQGAFDDLVIRVATDAEGDFSPVGKHGRARLVLGQEDAAVREILAAEGEAPSAPLQ